VAKTRYRKNMINMKNGEICVYASPRVSYALQEILEDMTIYKGVRLTQVLEAVYKQGLKNGRAEAVEVFEVKSHEARKSLDYRKPGRPKQIKRRETT